MHVHVLTRTQVVPLAPAEVFRFFGDIRNLEPLTPPWLRFRVLTDPGTQLGAGALIEYRLTLHAVPVRWITRIEEWEPDRRFVDTQIRGPYAMWEHTHEFTPDRRRHQDRGQRAIRPAAGPSRSARTRRLRAA